MNISEYIALCKKNSYDLKKFHPTPENHATLLDISAQNFGFKHYTSMINLQKILPLDVPVSNDEIEKAGGDYCEFLEKGILYDIDILQESISIQLRITNRFTKPIVSFLNDNNEHDDSGKCLNVLSNAGDISVNPTRFSDDTRLTTIKAIEQIITDSHLKDLWEEDYERWVMPHHELIDTLKGQLSLQH